jgi:tRNA 5-methylaminomethyl-2-thiouridine biosynthesis bifunctional protein
MLGTFTVAGFVRRGLSAAGFSVSKRPGYGRKRERLDAIKGGTSKNRGLNENPIKPIIIGAGIAGASLTRSFLLRGIAPTLIDPGDGSAASGNPAAVVKPRLDLQDRPESRFYLNAYLYAQDVYAGPHVVMRGVAHLAKNETEAARLKKIAAQAALPPEHMVWLGANDMKDKCGLESAFGGLWFDRAPVIDPMAMTESFTREAAHIKGKVMSLRQTVNGDWQALGAGDEALASGTDIYICAGADIETLLPDIGVRYSRGQVTRAWLEGGSNPLKCAVNYGGYAVPLGEEVLLGATHSWLDWENVYAVREADDVENMRGFTGISGAVVRARAARASVRVTTLDTLPVCGETLRQGLHVITGLSGRGFVYAPLIAEQMVSAAMDEPLAMANDACARFLPK